MTSACRPLTAWRRLAVPLCAAALLTPGPAGADSCSSLSLGASSSFPTGTGTAPSAVAVGDFDKNGTLDVAVANNASNSFAVLLGSGSGGLGTALPYGTVASPVDIVAGDLDRDGRLDLVVASGATAQVQVHQGLVGGGFMSGTPFSVGVAPTRIALADFNRDGWLDLVVVSEAGQRVRIFQGLASLTFGSIPVADLNLPATGPTAAVPGDFNRDGSLDLAVALRMAGQVAVFLGNGTGALSAGPTVPVGPDPRDIVAGDIDRDGRLDLVTANGSSADVSVLLGTGGGNFATQTPAAVLGGQPLRVALADLDRDGVLDLVVLDGTAGTPRLVAFRGNATPPSLFLPTPYATSLPVSSGPLGLAIGDFTSDGRPDLVTALSASNQAVVVPNASGSTCVQSSFGAARSFAAGDDPVAVAAADFDEDGRTDLVAADRTGSAISMLRGTAAGYGAPVGYPVDLAPRGVATADFNFDGHADVVAALGTTGSGKVQVFRGDGTGLLVPGFAANVGNNLAAVAAGDFNGDGAPDVAVASEDTNEVLVLLGNGAGGFGAPISTLLGSAPPVVIAPRALVTGDFDGNGRLDLAVACSGSNTVWVLLGNGSGTFTVGSSPAVGTAPWGIAAADLDGDLKTDLVTANHGSGNVSVLKGTGTGTFGSAVSYAVDTFPTGVALLPVDNTARPDIVVSTAGAHTVHVLLDNGSGGFNLDPGPLAVRSSPQAVVPVDVDRDGRLDVVIPCKTSDAVVVLLTRPPSFQVATRVKVGSQPAGAATADLDGDGDLDLAVASTGGDSITLLVNNGAGTFSPSTWPALSTAAGAAPTAVVAADFDRDGILDLAVNDAGAGKVSVFRGLGGGTYAAPVSFPAGSLPDDLAASDVDRDGRVDLLVCNKLSAGTVTFLRNTTTLAGFIAFALPGVQDVYAVGDTPTAIFVADFNRDGQLDFAVANDGSGPPPGPDTLTVAYGDGTGLFPTRVSLSLVGGDAIPLSVTGADFDGDGDVDLATAAFLTDTLSVFENVGSSFSAAPDRIAAPDVAAFVTAADLNRDGKTDLVAVAAGLKVLRSKGSLALPNPFEDAEDFVAGVSPRFALFGDWNRDGWPDAAVVNGGSDDVSILLSTACTARQLELTVQPAACVTTSPFLLQAQVTARDGGGNLAACAAGTVTPAIAPGTGETGAILGGPGPQPLSGGVASFTDLSIDRPGRRYRLEFSLPGVPAVESRSFTLGAQLAIVGPTSFCPSTSAVYGAEGSYDEYAWTRTPPGAPAFAYTPTVTLTPPDVGPYVLGLAVRVDGCSASTSRTIWYSTWQKTTLAINGLSTVCVDCIGGTVQPADEGGGAVTSRQWGYRTVAAGPITSLPGESGETYVLKGTDFPGPGSYYLVVSSTLTCSFLGPPQVSQELPITVSAAVSTNEVQFLAVTSRGAGASGENLLQWVNSTGTPEVVRIRWNKAPSGTSACVPPLDPVAGTVSEELDILNPPPATKGQYAHSGLEVNTAYCYAVFVRKAGAWAPGRIVKARPFDASGPVKWAYSTGATAVVPPVVGKDGILVMSNDRTVHAITRGSGGGVWPAGWVPRAITGVANSRSPVVPFSVLVNGADSVLFVGDDAGDVHAFNAKTGQAVWGPVTPSASGTITGAPGAILQQYGGVRDLVLVGTRNQLTTNPSEFFGLSLTAGGNVAGFNGGGTLGPVNGTPAVDYATQRVYFASRQHTLGKPTLWCVQMNATDPALSPAAVWSRDLGDVDGSPVLRNGRVYVGANSGIVYSLDAATGFNDRTFSTGDGPVKGFLFPDRRNDSLLFATSTKVWSISDTAGGFVTNWSWTMPVGSPSIVLYRPQTNYVYVGGAIGKLWQLDFTYPAADPSFAKSWTLGDGTGQIGAPTLDIGVSPPLLIVGSESGVLYGVEVPF